MDFGRPNVEIGRKMGNGQLLFLRLRAHTHTHTHTHTHCVCVCLSVCVSVCARVHTNNCLQCLPLFQLYCQPTCTISNLKYDFVMINSTNHIRRLYTYFCFCTSSQHQTTHQCGAHSGLPKYNEYINRRGIKQILLVTLKIHALRIYILNMCLCTKAYFVYFPKI